MGTLDQITKMRRQGVSDEEIINSLTEQGVSPREINDAMKQAQIKEAISEGNEMGEEMQPSIMEGNETPAPIEQEEQYTPRPAPTYSAQTQAYQPSTYEEQPAEQEQYQPQAYQQQTYQQQPQQEQYYPQEGYAPSAGADTDTIIEIADQLFSEKIKKIQKQIDSYSETSSLVQNKVDNVSERLKKIESIMDKLQIAILEKVGSYGQNLDSIKKEMSMMQDSFSKMISPQKQTEMKKQIPQNPQSGEQDDFSALRNISKK